MNDLTKYLHSSIGKKQIVAVTGLLLIGFVLVHLAGNFFIYAGPDAFNGYAQKLHNLRPGLYVLEGGLLIIFLVHLFVTYLLVVENINARPRAYRIIKPMTAESVMARLMPMSGALIVAFVIWHLLDFTFVDHEGPKSFMPDGQPQGLYGVVYNAFADPIHSSLYVLCMVVIGIHLAHGVQSFYQTFGLANADNADFLHKISAGVGILIALGYSSIPIYVFLDSLKYSY